MVRLNQSMRSVVMPISSLNYQRNPDWVGEKLNNRSLSKVILDEQEKDTMGGMGLKLAGQGGEGILSTAKGLFDRTISGALNILPSSDDTARPGYPGERHGVLQLNNGKPGVANYMGPGTALMKRLARGDPPRTMEDRVAQAHDIRYGLAKNQAGVAQADTKMINKLLNMKKNKQGNRFNIEMGLRPIQAKRAIEAKGLVKPGKIASFGDLNPSEQEIAKAKLKELEQAGFGMPGQKLKMKLLRSMRKPAKKKGNGLSLPGGGLSLPGGGVKQKLNDLVLLGLRRLAPLLMAKAQRGTGINMREGIKLLKNPKLQKLVLMKVNKLMGSGDGANRDRHMVLGSGVLSMVAKTIAKVVAPIVINKVSNELKKKVSGSGLKVVKKMDLERGRKKITDALSKEFLGVFSRLEKGGFSKKNMSGMTGTGIDFGKLLTKSLKSFVGNIIPPLKLIKNGGF